MTDTGDIRLRPEALPPTISLWQRAIKDGLTLNDHVEAVHIALYDTSEEYRAFLEAVYDDDAVEGSLAVDTMKAAELLRDHAITMNNMVGRKKVATVIKALNVVLRRYNKSRRERRDTVGGMMISGPREQVVYAAD